MAELQRSQIRIVRENLHALDCDCGGAYRIYDVEIHVDESLPPRTQRIAVTHEILGSYLGVFIDPEIISEMAERIVDALDETSRD